MTSKYERIKFYGYVITDLGLWGRVLRP